MVATKPRKAKTAKPVLPRGVGVIRFGTAGFVDAFGSGFFYPFSLLFYTKLSRYPISTVGLVLTLVALAALPSLFVISRLVNRWGPRVVLVAAALLRAVCFAGFVIHPDLPSLVLCGLLVSVGNRADNAAAPLLAVRMAPEGQSSRWLALSRVVLNAGMGGGALISAVFVVSTPPGFTVVGIVDAVSFVLTAALYLSIKATGTAGDNAGYRQRGRRPHPWLNLMYLRVVSVNGLLLTSNLAVESGLAVFILQALGMRAWVVGVLFAVNTVMVTMLQLPVSRLLEQFRPVVVLAAGGLSYIALYAALALSEQVPRGLRIDLLIAGTIIYTLGELAVSQAALVLLTGIPSPEDQGSYLSFNQVFVGAATALAPLLVTNLLAGRATILWWVLSAVSVVSALIVVTVRRVSGFRNPSLPAARGGGRPAGSPGALPITRLQAPCRAHNRSTVNSR